MVFRATPTRRQFVTSLSAVAAFGALARPIGAASGAETPETVQEVIDFLKRAASRPVRNETVDTIKSGGPSQKIKGVVTTFLDNTEVIERTIELGANLLVTHEPTFYNHEDTVDWLSDNPVYRYKRGLLEKNNIVVWRFHDYMHAIAPDPMLNMLTQMLGWREYAENEKLSTFQLPPQNVGTLAAEVKRKLGAERVRLVGDPAMFCRHVGIQPGSAGGQWHIAYLRRTGVQVLIAGEINEWETSEYIRDAIQAGEEKALIVVGHARTEEPGMKWLAEWLGGQLPHIPVHHVPAGDAFIYV